MWRLLIAACVAVALANAQPRWNDLLHPKPVHVAGVVVDPEGNPVAEALVDHSDGPLQTLRADPDGRFQLDTRAPVLAVRKAGYRTELLRTEDATDARITLQKLDESPSFPICPDSASSIGLDGAAPHRLRFASIPQVTATRPIQSEDSVTRMYHVDPDQGGEGVLHGSGPNWSYGTPSSFDVWRSVEYDETTYYAPWITDARGRFADGNRWRYLGMFGESAFYHDADEATAKVLDEFLDGACLMIR